MKNFQKLDIPISKLRTCAVQSCRRTSSSRISSLKKKIVNAGKLLHPIQVVPIEGTDLFTIGIGHRRTEVATQLGWTHVPAIVRTDMTAEQLFWSERSGQSNQRSEDTFESWAKDPTFIDQIPQNDAKAIKTIVEVVGETRARQIGLMGIAAYGLYSLFSRLKNLMHQSSEKKYNTIDSLHIMEYLVRNYPEQAEIKKALDVLRLSRRTSDIKLFNAVKNDKPYKFNP